MPLSKNPHAYPVICWNVLEAFERDAEFQEFTIDPKSERVDGKLEVKEQLRRARQLQLQFNGFRQSLRVMPHAQVHVMEGLEFVIRGSATEGWVLKVQRKNSNWMSRAIEAGMRNAGLSIEPPTFRPQPQQPRQPAFVPTAPRKYEVSFAQFDSLEGQSEPEEGMPPHEAIEQADALVSDLLGLSTKAGTKEAELPKTLAEFNRQRGEQPGLDPAALVTKGLIDAEKKNEQGS